MPANLLRTMSGKSYFAFFESKMGIGHRSPWFDVKRINSTICPTAMSFSKIQFPRAPSVVTVTSAVADIRAEVMGMTNGAPHVRLSMN